MKTFKISLTPFGKTRKGLYSLMDKRPDLFDSLKPQFYALNDLVSILLETGKGFYHPDKFYKPNISMKA